MTLTLSRNVQIFKKLGDPWIYSCVHTYRLNIVLQFFLDFQYFQHYLVLFLLFLDVE